jgi:hypothetical protein
MAGCGHGRGGKAVDNLSKPIDSVSGRLTPTTLTGLVQGPDPSLCPVSRACRVHARGGGGRGQWTIPTSGARGRGIGRGRPGQIMWTSVSGDLSTRRRDPRAAHRWHSMGWIYNTSVCLLDVGCLACPMCCNTWGRRLSGLRGESLWCFYFLLCTSVVLVVGMGMFRVRASFRRGLGTC